MKRGPSRRAITSLGLGIFSLLIFVSPLKAGITFLYIVNTTSDTVVANACVNATAGCSLRGAMEAANAHGASTIQFTIPASDPLCSAGVCTINLSSALPTITVNMEFDGPGADKLTVKPVTNGQFRVFSVTNVGTVFFFGMTISNGLGIGVNGGGIFHSSQGGTVNIINCTISGNQTVAGGVGGGIHNANFSTTNITNSTVIGNNSGTAGPGGGIGNFGTMNVTNSTVTDNVSGDIGSSCSGGGIFNTNNGVLKVTNSTISGNTASGTTGGGVCNSSGVITVKNSIIASNTASGSGFDVNGNFASAGFNLIGKTDGSSGFAAATDLTGTIASPLDPGLDPAGPQNNGGPTKTVALVSGSQAIDKGTSTGLTGTLTTDQRGAGFARTFDKSGIVNAAGGDGTDIGAFELGIAITGTITYGNAIGGPMPRFVSQALISASGSPAFSVFSGPQGPTFGQYSLSGFGAGSYTVTPSKTGGVNGITSFDAAKIAAHVAGTTLLTGNQLLVADVSNNGSISSFDAANIANFVVGATPAGITGAWKFLPVSRTYPSITNDISGEDYSALLIGEVSGNWSNADARPVGSRQVQLAAEDDSVTESGGGPQRITVVSAPQLVASAGQEVIIPVNVEGTTGKEIISYEFDLRYDPTVIQPQADPVEIAGTLSRSFSIASNSREPGLLRVAVYGPMPIDGSGVLLNLKFTALGSPGSLSPLVWESIMFNEGDSGTIASDGQIEISAAWQKEK